MYVWSVKYDCARILAISFHKIVIEDVRGGFGAGFSTGSPFLKEYVWKMTENL